LKLGNKKLVWLIYFLFIIAFVSMYLKQEIHPDTTIFISGFKDSAPERFIFPLLYYITIPIYNLFQEFAFILIPFLCFFIGLHFLIKLFEHFNLNLLWIPGSFIALRLLGAGGSPIFLFSYTRDALMFALASAFTYYFIVSYFNNHFHWKQMLVLNILMIFNREMGIVFGLFFIVILTKKSWATISPMFTKALTGIFLGFENLQHFLQVGINSFSSFKLEALLSFARNPLYAFSLGAFLLKPTKLHLILISVTIVLAYAINNSSTLFSGVWVSFNGQEFRYLFSFFPMHLFFLAKTSKDFLLNA